MSPRSSSAELAGSEPTELGVSLEKGTEGEGDCGAPAASAVSFLAFFLDGVAVFDAVAASNSLCSSAFATALSISACG